MGQIRDFFKDQISVYFGSSSQNVLKFDLKSPVFVLFGTNLTKFRPEFDIRVDDPLLASRVRNICCPVYLLFDNYITMQCLIILVSVTRTCSRILLLPVFQFETIHVDFL